MSESSPQTDFSHWPDSISIVSPVYNEEESLIPFYQRIKSVMGGYPNWELWLIDDGSADRSVEVIQRLRQDDPRVKLLSLSRNYGHQTALIAGYDHAFGEVVITLDSDLQHPPEVIPEMIEAWSQGNFIVFGRRKRTETLSFFKGLTSRLFYKLINRISQVELIENVPDFRLMDQQVVAYLRKFEESKPFLRGIVSDIGFKRALVDYDQARREFGESKYNFQAMLKLAWVGIMSFSPLPLRISTYLGVVISFGSILMAAAILLFRDFFGYSVDGVPSILVGVFFLGGIQLICLGIMGEYITKLFMEVKKRPRYCVQELKMPTKD